MEYDRIHVSEEVDVNKANASKRCGICHYWYFLDKGFKFEPSVCNGCHDLIQKTMNFNDFVIGFIKGSDYRTHFWFVSKDYAINMKSSDLNEKNGLLLFFHVQV